MTGRKKSWFKVSLIVFIFISNAARAVTVVHTNDVQGDIEPCGCRSNPQGGMARKANLLKRIKDSFIVQVDAGDLLYSTQRVPALLSDQAELQASYLLKSMEMLHHDVVVPGEKDFALGVKSFEKLIHKSSIHFLVANLKKKNGKPFLQSHVILSGPNPDGSPGGTEGKKVRVAVIGLVGEGLEWPKELKVTSMIEAAKKEVAALKGKADYVIVVTHQGLDEDKKLAAKVSGIDIIVGGHSQSFLQNPIQVRSTAIFQSSFRNQYVGVIPLSQPLQPDKYTLLGLDAGYDSPADAPAPMDLLVKEFKQAIGTLNSKQETSIQDMAVSSETATDKKFQTFPQCASCHMKQFDFWRKTAHANALQPLLQKQQEKNKECLACHTVGLGDPKGFQNVNTLAEYFQQSGGADSKNESTGPTEGTPVGLSTEDLSGLLTSLHEAKSLKATVKVGSKDSVARHIPEVLHSLTRSWAPVQCENCHLPGKDHPFSGQYSKNVEKTVCLSCHTAERAPQWYTSSGQPDWKLIDAKRGLITCPAGDLSESEE